MSVYHLDKAGERAEKGNRTEERRQRKRGGVEEKYKAKLGCPGFYKIIINRTKQYIF